MAVKEDAQGGVVPEDLARAKRVDLITLPDDVEGTNCSSCLYAEKSEDGVYCSHPQVEMPVNERMCCMRWDRPGTLRAWEEVND